MYRVYAHDPHDAHQPRHPPPPGAAAGERPPQDRADERPAVLAAGHAGHLLRRRDRHGRQRLPGRPQRRAHAHAVERRPQRRVLPRQSAAAVPAGDHRPGVPLRGGQRRGAAEQPALAAVVDEAPDRAAQALPGLRPRHAGVPAARERQGAGLHPPPRRRRLDRLRARRRDRAGGGQPVVLRPDRHPRPARAPRRGAGGAVRRQRVPPHHRRGVQPDPGCLRLLLVLPATPAPRCPGDRSRAR